MNKSYDGFRATRRHIICFGNPLHGDDGFGPALYQRLSRLPRPVGLRLTDAGVPGPAALALFQDCEEVVIVDASAPAGAPGRISRPTPCSVATESSPTGHGLGVGYLLRALSALPEPAPHIEIIAVEAYVVTPFQPFLSAPVARAVDEVATLLRPYFGANGHG